MLPRRSAPPRHFVSDAALLPFASPSSMLCSVQFSAHSLDAIAVIVANFPLTDFTGGYELSLAAQPPAHSHLRQTQRRFVHCFSTLLYTSRRVDHTKLVLQPTQHVVGCICPTFLSVFCAHLGHGCTSCFFFFCPAIHSFECHLLWLRNQIVGRAFQAPRCSAPPTAAGCHSLLATL